MKPGKLIFGNESAAKVLFCLRETGEAHAAQISRDLSMPGSTVISQLDRFERAGILVSRTIGRNRLYKFNKRNPLTSIIEQLVSHL